MNASYILFHLIEDKYYWDGWMESQQAYNAGVEVAVCKVAGSVMHHCKEVCLMKGQLRLSQEASL